MRIKMVQGWKAPAAPQGQSAGAHEFSRGALAVAEYLGITRQELEAAAANIAANGGVFVVPTVVGRG